MYAFMEISVIFNKSGLVDVTNDVRTVKSDLYPTVLEMAPDAFFVTLNVILLLQELPTRP